MDFDLSEEQRLLKESLDRLIGDRYAFEQRKAYGQSPEGWSRELWGQYAELGLLGLPFAERYGGSGGGPVETMIAMEAFGRALALEPFLATVVLGGGISAPWRHCRAMRRAGAADRRRQPDPRLRPYRAAVALRPCRHFDEGGARRRRLGARRRKGGGAARRHRRPTDRHRAYRRRAARPRRRRRLYRRRQGAGVSRRGYPTQDGLRAAEITLAGVRVGPEGVLGEPGAALPLVERVVDEAIAALCAEAVGAMAVMHELTVEYLKTRRQFGREIGSFQVLQHRAVDMLVALEQARSMAMFATMMAAEENAAERRNALSAAKVQIGRSGRLVGQQAIQLHGGIGMTMEYKVGHYFKRVTMIDTMFGDADHHLRELARRGAPPAAA